MISAEPEAFPYLSGIGSWLYVQSRNVIINRRKKNADQGVKITKSSRELDMTQEMRALKARIEPVFITILQSRSCGILCFHQRRHSPISHPGGDIYC